jgi:hypothetical protein
MTEDLIREVNDLIAKIEGSFPSADPDADNYLPMVDRGHFVIEALIPLREIRVRLQDLPFSDEGLEVLTHLKTLKERLVNLVVVAREVW